MVASLAGTGSYAPTFQLELDSRSPQSVFPLSHVHSLFIFKLILDCALQPPIHGTF